MDMIKAMVVKKSHTFGVPMTGSLRKADRLEVCHILQVCMLLLFGDRQPSQWFSCVLFGERQPSLSVRLVFLFFVRLVTGSQADQCLVFLCASGNRQPKRPVLGFSCFFRIGQPSRSVFFVFWVLFCNPQPSRSLFWVVLVFSRSSPRETNFRVTQLFDFPIQTRAKNVSLNCIIL